jgi:SAM-dependent methyltransferase
LDLGCGAMGILGPLARRVGPTRRVVGVDRDPLQLRGARELVASEALCNVDVLEADAYDTNATLAGGTFDLVHTRFLFAPAGRDKDAAAWSCYPSSAAWDQLKGVILEAFRCGGGDFDAGRRTFGMLRDHGAEDLRIRAAVLALPPKHPYLRLPIQFATSRRERILKEGLMDAATLDRAIAGVEPMADDPRTVGLTFVVTQVWGRKPE